jgi:hypothetical protein
MAAKMFFDGGSCGVAMVSSGRGLCLMTVVLGVAAAAGGGSASGCCQQQITAPVGWNNS